MGCRINADESRQSLARKRSSGLSSHAGNGSGQDGQQSSWVDFQTYIQGAAHGIGESDPAARDVMTPSSSWSAWDLRRALRLLRLPRDHVQSLRDTELVGVLADYFGVDQPLET